MSKTRAVTIMPVLCPKGHTFYPRVLPDGNIKQYEKCPVRSCRTYLDRKKVEKNIEKRNKFLIHGQKKTNIKQHPYCNLCKIVLWDNDVLKKHNERMHPQK